MIRKTLTIISLIGLLLSVALWGVSCFANLGMKKGRNLLSVRHGAVTYIRTQTALQSGATFQRKDFETPLLQLLPEYQQFDGGVPWGVRVPLWTLVIIFSASTYCFCFAYKRRTRRKLGLCLKCGYDLRGSKEWCPECGKTFDSRLLKKED